MDLGRSPSHVAPAGSASRSRKCRSRAPRRRSSHRALGTELALATVDVGAKADAGLVDREDRALALGAVAAGSGGAAPALDLVGHRAVSHREDLKAARVGDDRTLPAHELIQPAE